MVRPHHTTAAVAITVALTAGLAPIAAADPAPLARAEAVIAANHSTASTAARPNPDQQTATGSNTYSGPCSEVCSGGAGSYGSVTQRSWTPDESGATLPHDSRPRSVAAPSLYSTASIPPTVVRVVAHDRGFDWGDAGIGAGATLILLGIGFAGTRAATTGRRRDIREQRAVVTN